MSATVTQVTVIKSHAYYAQGNFSFWEKFAHLCCCWWTAHNYSRLRSLSNPDDYQINDNQPATTPFYL